MSEIAFSARKVSKVFPNGAVALRDVSLDVAEGETVCLIGESGCGKTTLLRMFNRLEDPSEGSIEIAGRQAAELDPIELRRRTGYVQQEGGLLPHWTVARNVEMVPRLLGWDESTRRARSRELLGLVGLDPREFGDRHPAQLSGGQRQRVAFARALAADPPVVLLDEPFGALDALTRLELQSEFTKLKRDLAKTILLVTHDLDEAVRLGDRVAVMRHGRMLQIDAPAELLSSPRDPYVRELLTLAGVGS